MSRPKKPRVICEPPATLVLLPAGAAIESAEPVNLTLDEYEVFNLVDGRGLEHKAAAKLMQVSRPTVTRMLETARCKVAGALASGSGLVIDGGEVRFCPGGPRCPHRRILQASPR